MDKVSNNTLAVFSVHADDLIRGRRRCPSSLSWGVSEHVIQQAGGVFSAEIGLPCSRFICMRNRVESSSGTIDMTVRQERFSVLSFLCYEHRDDGLTRSW